ncbi:DUF624 domain-containing protein [Vagococcus fluvialis]|uniref:DUF624 domain-containing protein n=1 Tax=Vagococcus fluvialis TaxID=2738 RepID=UPI001F5CBB78|nr:DUF624 domain-containing protein [Vagococcus fluvialis]
MKNILSIDGWYFRVFSKLANLIILNLLFIISIVPVFTLGVSIMALISSLNELKSDGTLAAYKVFTTHFKQNIKKGMILFSVELVGWFVPASLIYVSLKFIPLLSTLLMIVFSFFLLVLVVFPFVYTLKNLALREAISQTFAFVTLKIPYAIASFIVLVAVAYLCLKYSIIFIFLLGVSLIFYLQLQLVRKGGMING